MTGIEPVCNQLLFLRLIRLRRYIPIYLVRPERIERSLLAEYASKAYGSTYSPKDASSSLIFYSIMSKILINCKCHCFLIITIIIYKY